MYNKSILIGRVTKDIELKSTQSGTPVCSFSIAVNRSYDREKTDFINIVAWRKTAEFVSQYFHKGSAIGVEGRIEMRDYTDKDGNNRRSFEVIADNAFFVEKKDKQSEPAQNQFVDAGDDEDIPF